MTNADMSYQDLYGFKDGTICMAFSPKSMRKIWRISFVMFARNSNPKPTFVIGIMGQNGFKEAQGNMAIVKTAQASMNNIADFKGNVKAIPTDIYWDKKANDAYPTWRKNLEAELIGSDFPYHY